MNILLADADRDLLTSYDRVLTLDGHRITTAFDGAQALNLIDNGQFDLAVIGEELPRVKHDVLAVEMLSRDIAFIVIINGRLNVARLLQDKLANAYLPLPFLPEDIRRLISEIETWRAFPDHIRWADADVDAAGFRFSGSRTRLTCHEMDILNRLQSGKEAGGRKDRTLIHAINEKLSRLNLRARIEYRLEKGYALVTEHE